MDRQRLGTAMLAFGIVGLLLVVVGIKALALSGVPAAGAFGRRALLPITGGVLTVLLALLLSDAAAAFGGHGPAMHVVVVTLWACVGLTIIADVSLIVSGVTSRR